MRRHLVARLLRAGEPKRCLCKGCGCGGDPACDLEHLALACSLDLHFCCLTRKFRFRMCTGFCAAVGAQPASVGASQGSAPWRGAVQQLARFAAEAKPLDEMRKPKVRAFKTHGNTHT
jgi:hypothetical protein